MTSSSTRSTGVVASASSAGAAAGGGEHRVALAPEPARQHVAVVLVVVHDQDHAPRRRRLPAELAASGLPLACGGRQHPPVAQQLIEPLGGAADAVEVGAQRVVPGPRRLPAQPVAGRPDALQGGTERVARGREVGGP
jgi:hypothetical protein